MTLLRGCGEEMRSHGGRRLLGAYEDPHKFTFCFIWVEMGGRGCRPLTVVFKLPDLNITERNCWI